MATASRKRHVSSAAAEKDEKRAKNDKTEKKSDQIDPKDVVEKILHSKKHANAVFDIFEVLQVKLSFVLNVDVSSSVFSFFLSFLLKLV